MSAAEIRAEARRILQICRICNYCNGFCPVFAAAERRPQLVDADLDHLAHLCHACRNCFYACQYAPPHVFAVNLPRALAGLRHQLYLEYVWPVAGRWLLNHPFTGLLLAIACGWLLVLGLIQINAAFGLGEGSLSPFYRRLSWGSMVFAGALPMLGSGVALAIAWGRYWRLTRPPRPRGWRQALLQTFHAVLSLRHLSGGGVGCNDRDAAFSQSRRQLHQLLFAGLALAAASTLSASWCHHVLGLVAPYPVLSIPVILGVAGGIMMLIAAWGLGWVTLKADPQPRTPHSSRLDLAFSALILIVSASGLALLGGRTTDLMPVLLVIHLGSVVAFFTLLPYSKFLHAGYRAMALLQESLSLEDRQCVPSNGRPPRSAHPTDCGPHQG